MRPPSAISVQDGAVVQALAETAEIAASRERVRSGLFGRERALTLLLAAGFLVTAVCCAALVPSSTSLSIRSAALLVAVYAVVSQIEFEIGPGSAVPTELVLVPMLFLLPPGSVPLAVACGLLVGGLAERLRSRRHADRIAVLLCSSWHSIGPAIVIGVFAPGPPAWSDTPVYVVALLAQLLLDDASVVVRHRVGRSVPVSQLVPALALVAVVDVALAPLALLVAFVAVDQPLAVLAVLPLAGLLHALGIDRRKRIDESVVLGRAVEDASREARSDPLTGIGNRLAWQEAVEAARSRLARNREPASVVLVDLDRLKETNDRLGHDAGDRLIRALAQVLVSVVPEETTLARIGGDEFAVLALGLDEEGCEALVRRIQLELGTLEIGGLPASASVGTSSCPPCASLDEALRLADERLYADKGAVTDP